MSESTLFVTSHKDIICYDLFTPANLAVPTTLSLHAAPIRHLAISPASDTLISAALDGRVAFTNVNTLKVEERSETGDPIIAACMHPDGGFVYAITAAQVRVWQVGEAQLIRELEAYFPAAPVAITLFRKAVRC